MFCCIILTKYIIYHVFSEMKAGSGKKAVDGDGAKRPESPHGHAPRGFIRENDAGGKNGLLQNIVDFRELVYGERRVPVQTAQNVVDLADAACADQG